MLLPNSAWEVVTYFHFWFISQMLLTHWGRVTHICVSKLTIIGSDNGLLPGWQPAIIWPNAGMFLIGPLRTNFSEILIEIPTFLVKKMHLKMSSGKRRPFCLGFNVLMIYATPAMAVNWLSWKHDNDLIIIHHMTWIFLHCFFFSSGELQHRHSITHCWKVVGFQINHFVLKIL